MRIMKTIWVVSLTAALTVGALAQGFGGGQGRGGFRMPPEPTGAMLLQRKDVQTELNLTEDEKTKLQALQDKAQSDMQAMFQNGGSGGDRSAMRATMQKYFAQMSKDALAILTKEQAARLAEINIQLAGNLAVTFPDVQTKIAMTDDQIGKVKDLQSKQQEANQALGQKMRDQEITMEELQASRQKNDDALKAEIGKILTDDQRAKLKAMGGKEFKPDTSGGGR